MRGTSHRSAHPSTLVRELAAACGVSAAAPAGQDVAERLGAWLSVADAITLRGALHARTETSGASSARATGDAVAVHAALSQELQRVRATLEASIHAVEPAPSQRRKADHSHHGVAAVAPLPLDPAAEFALLHQRCGEQQRRMEMSIDALRTHVREVLAKTSPDMARLAALDGVMDQMLGGREQHLLATVPAFLKKRMEQLRRQETKDADRLPGEAAHSAEQPAWLEQLIAEFQQALLAELDLRLQPVVGMVEALQGSH